MCDTDTKYKQVMGIYMHTYMQIDHRHLHSRKGVASESTYIIGVYNKLHISMYNSKSLLQRDVFQASLATCADFSISNFGEM